MNIIETLPKTFEHNGVTYTLSMHVTAFNRLCICYREMLGNRNILCSVCVEPENKPINIEDTVDFALNDHVGNERTLDAAAKMLKNYVNKTYIFINKPKTFWEFIKRIDKEKEHEVWTYALNLGQKYHNEGKNPDEYLDKIIKDVEEVRQNL